MRGFHLTGWHIRSAPKPVVASLNRNPLEAHFWRGAGISIRGVFDGGGNITSVTFASDASSPW
jgi:hypothetical protein